jgi:hypothetical protein
MTLLATGTLLSQSSLSPNLGLSNSPYLVTEINSSSLQQPEAIKFTSSNQGVFKLSWERENTSASGDKFYIKVTDKRGELSFEINSSSKIVSIFTYVNATISIITSPGTVRSALYNVRIWFENKENIVINDLSKAVSIISNSRTALQVLYDDNTIANINVFGLSENILIGFTTYIANKIRDIVIYNGEIFVGGDFGLKKWNPQQEIWEKFGFFDGGMSSNIQNGLFPNSIFQMKVVNNKLYVFGNFTNVTYDGTQTSCKYIVSYNGTEFSQIPGSVALPDFTNSNIYSPKSSSSPYADDKIVSLYINNNEDVYIIDKGIFDLNNFNVKYTENTLDTISGTGVNLASNIYILNSISGLIEKKIYGTILNDYKIDDKVYISSAVVVRGLNNNVNTYSQQNILSVLDLTTSDVSYSSVLNGSLALSVLPYNNVSYHIGSSLSGTGDTGLVSDRILNSKNIDKTYLYSNLNFKKIHNGISLYNNPSYKTQTAVLLDVDNNAYFFDSSWSGKYGDTTTKYYVPLNNQSFFPPSSTSNTSNLIKYDLGKLNGNIKDIVLGLDTVAVLTNDGDIYVWGNNSYGQLGSTIKIGDSSGEPIKIGDDFNKIFVCNNTYYAIKNDGSMFAWGQNIVPMDGGASAYLIPGLTDTTAYVSELQQIIINIKGDYAPLSRTGKNSISDTNNIGSLWKTVSVGPYGVYAIDSTGLLYYWGFHGVGPQYYSFNKNESYIKPISDVPSSNNEVVLLGCPKFEGDSDPKKSIPVTGDPGEYTSITHDSLWITTPYPGYSYINYFDSSIVVFSYILDGINYTKIWSKNTVDKDVEFKEGRDFTKQSGINSLFVGQITRSGTGTTQDPYRWIVTDTSDTVTSNIYSDNLNWNNGYKKIYVKFNLIDTKLSERSAPNSTDNKVSYENPSADLQGKTNFRLACIDNNDSLALESGLKYKWDLLTKNKKWRDCTNYFGIDNDGLLYLLPNGSLSTFIASQWNFDKTTNNIYERGDAGGSPIFTLSNNASVSSLTFYREKLLIGGYFQSNSFFADPGLAVYNVSDQKLISPKVIDFPFRNGVNDIIPMGPLSQLAPLPSPTPTPTITPSISVTPSITPSISVTPTNTPTVTPSSTPAPTASETPTNTPTNTSTPTQTPTPSVTASVTPTNTRTPTKTPSGTPSETTTPTPTTTPTITPSITNSLTPSVTRTKTPTPTLTISITSTQRASWDIDGAAIEFNDVEKDAIRLNCSCLADEEKDRN